MYTDITTVVQTSILFRQSSDVCDDVTYSRNILHFMLNEHLKIRSVHDSELLSKTTVTHSRNKNNLN